MYKYMMLYGLNMTYTETFADVGSELLDLEGRDFDRL
jgi:hypothetical protein